MDSASSAARGAHVIIKAGLDPDVYDRKLSDFISKLFPGRAEKIVKRNDLANPARAYAKGYAYRLIECGFISNSEDMSVFNKSIDKIAHGILECFGIKAQIDLNQEENNATEKTQPTMKKSNDQIAQEVIQGKWGNGEYRKQKLTTAGYDYSAVQALVNKKLVGESFHPAKTMDQLVDEVIIGKWGNGQDRVSRLKKAGYDPVEIQKRVNQKLK